MYMFYIGSRRFSSDPLDLGTDIRPYSLPTPLGVHQELSGYARAASWGPPSTTMPPFTTLSTFLPPAGDTSASLDVRRRPSLTSSLIRPADASALGSLAVPYFPHQQQIVTCPPCEPTAGSFLPQKPPSASSGDQTIDEIRQSLLSMTSLNSVFETNNSSPFSQTTIFDQPLSDASHKQPSFPPAPTSLLQPGTFSTIAPPTFDPNFNALTSAPLGQLALATTCSESFWQNSCLPFGDSNLYLYPGNRMMTTDGSQAAAVANNNDSVDDARQDSSLWRPY